MKRIALLTALVLATGCTNPLGTSMPECERGSSTMVLAVQSVPGSRYVSCVESLPVGWGYQNLEARSGTSRYWLDSDRMGLHFLEVQNVRSCEVGGARLAAILDGGVELWRDVDARTSVSVAIVPEGPTTDTTRRTLELAVDLRQSEIKGRSIDVTTAFSDDTTSRRIEQAAAMGAHVIVISIRDAEEGTMGLRLAGTTTEVSVSSLDDALDAIDDVETPATYRGNWYYVFDGGCVVYTFDAEGPGTATIEEDVTAALSLYDAEALRDSARDLGFDI